LQGRRLAEQGQGGHFGHTGGDVLKVRGGKGERVER